MQTLRANKALNADANITCERTWHEQNAPISNQIDKIRRFFFKKHQPVVTEISPDIKTFTVTHSSIKSKRSKKLKIPFKGTF